MKIKKMLSGLLAAAMVCSLLCVPAFAAEKDDVVKQLNGNDVWLDIKDVSSLEEDVSLKMRGWRYDSTSATWTMSSASDDLPGTVVKLPLGVTIAAGPNNDMSGGLIAYTADQDGVYIERLERIVDQGSYYDHDVLPLSTTGTLHETNTTEYWPYFDWSWGENNLLPSQSNGYRTLTTDYLVEKFGANTLIVFLDSKNEVSDTIYFLTGEKRPDSLALNSLSDAGIYFSETGDIVSSWAVDYVNAAFEAQLLSYGIEANHDFDLTGKITRAEFSRIAVDLYYVMSGTDSLDVPDNPFEDVDDNTDFDTAILAAYKLGIVTGKTPTLFRPYDLVTRQEAAAMLSRVYTKLGGEIPAVTATSFADNADIANYARDAVAFMSGYEIISGVGGNRFNPTGNASVEQALKIAIEMLDKLGS